MPVVFVTGANGFLANALIRHLIQEEYTVIGHMRQRSQYTGILHPQLTLIEDSSYTKESLVNYVQGVDCIIHTAAITRQDLLHAGDYETFHIDATRTLLEAATQCGIRTFMYISTANAIGYGAKENPGSETCVAKQPFLSSFYANSKLKAQQLVLQWPADMVRVVIAPTLMLGQGAMLSTSGELIRRAYHKRLIFCPPGGKNIVHVDDVAQLIVAALEQAPDRSVYLAAGENVSYFDFFRRMQQYTGQRSFIIQLPFFVMRIMGLLGDGIRWLGIRSNVSSVNMKILCIGNYYTARKAEQEFGIRFRSLDKILKDSL